MVARRDQICPRVVLATKAAELETVREKVVRFLEVVEVGNEIDLVVERFGSGAPVGVEHTEHRYEQESVQTQDAQDDAAVPALESEKELHRIEKADLEVELQVEWLEVREHSDEMFETQIG